MHKRPDKDVGTTRRSTKISDDDDGKRSEISIILPTERWLGPSKESRNKRNNVKADDK